jgi:tetratricopeptide (TPR) repeat protein
MTRSIGEIVLAAALLAAAACGSGEKKGEREPELLERASADLLAENYSAAAYRYDLYLRHNPDAPRKAWVLAQIGLCRNGSGDYEGALRTFDQALAASPDAALRAQIHYRRAIAQNFLDRPDAALADLGEVESSPKREEAVKTAEFLRILGVTAIRAGNWTRGRRALQELVEKHPQSQEASIARPLLTLKTFAVQVAGGVAPEQAAAKVTDFRRRGVEARAVDLPDRTGKTLLVGEFAKYADAVTERDRLKRMGVDGFILP